MVILPTFGSIVKIKNLIKIGMCNMLTACLVAILLLPACGDKRLNLHREFRFADEKYYGNNRDEAKNALEDFVERAENAEIVYNTQGMIYNRVMGTMWLRLAMIYKQESQDGQYAKAIGRAIYFFDQKDSFYDNKEYNSNKVETLHKFIREVDEHFKPAWQAKPKGHF